MKRLTRFKYLLCLGIIGAFFSSPSVWGQASISVSPITLDLMGKPGETVSGQVRVINTGNSPFKMHAYAWDWWYSDKDPSIYASPGTYKQHSAAPWIRFTPNDVVVPGGSVQVVNVTASLPKGLQGSKSAIVFFEMGSPERTNFEGGAGVYLSGRLGVSTTVTAKGTEQPALQVKTFKVIPAGRRTPMTVKYSMTNTGNVVVRPEGKVVFLGADQSVAGQTDIAGPTIFPGQTREIEAVYTAVMAKGQYKAMANVFFNKALGLDQAKGISIHENPFTIP